MPLAHQPHLQVDAPHAALLRSVSLVVLSLHSTPRYELRCFRNMLRWRGFRLLPRPAATLCHPLSALRPSRSTIDVCNEMWNGEHVQKPVNKIKDLQE